MSTPATRLASRVIGVLLLTLASQAYAAPTPHPTPTGACFEAAGQRYGVPPGLLAAIALQESAMNPAAFHRNRDGSVDIGLMQINSSWLPTLARHGIRERDLHDPCVNTLVGAWILADNLRRMGTNAQALGAYNARDPAKRVAYARQVLRRYVALDSAMRRITPPASPTPAR